MLWSMEIHLLHSELMGKERALFSQQTVRHTGHRRNFANGSEYDKIWKGIVDWLVKNSEKRIVTYANEIRMLSKPEKLAPAAFLEKEDRGGI